LSDGAAGSGASALPAETPREPPQSVMRGRRRRRAEKEESHLESSSQGLQIV